MIPGPGDYCLHACHSRTHIVSYHVLRRSVTLSINGGDFTLKSRAPLQTERRVGAADVSVYGEHL